MADLARLFLAAPLTEDARYGIAQRLRESAPGGLPGRVVRPENWHVTLRFLGQIDDTQRDRVEAEVDQAELGTAFPLRWGSLGAFPNPWRATVLWLGLQQGAEGLASIAAAVEEAVEAAGFPPEDRPFRAHLTLSRIRPQQDVGRLLDDIAAVGVAMDLDRIVLYRSHLGRGGARYEVVEEFPLG